MTQSDKLINTFISIKQDYDAKKSELLKPLCEFGRFYNDHHLGDDYLDFPYNEVIDLENFSDEIRVVYSEDASEYDEYVPKAPFSLWVEDKPGFLSKYKKSIKDDRIEELKDLMEKAQGKADNYKKQLKDLGYDC